VNNAPSQITTVMFLAYLKVSFSSRKLWLREVHFVDRDESIVDMMKTAFLLQTPEKDTKMVLLVVLRKTNIKNVF
jgi:hypothetical protein